MVPKAYVDTVHCTNNLANLCEVLHQDSQLWQVAMALNYSPQHGEQCFV